MASVAGPEQARDGPCQRLGVLPLFICSMSEVALFFPEARKRQSPKPCIDCNKIIFYSVVQIRK